MSDEDSQRISQLSDQNKRLEAELKRARISNKTSGPGQAWLALENSTAPQEEEETWFATYLDMMTLLLVLLVVMLSFAGKGVLSSTVESVASTTDSEGAAINHQLGIELIVAGSSSDEPSDDMQSSASVQEKLAALGIDTDIEEAPERSLSDLGLDQLGDDIDVIISAGVVSFRIKSEILFTSGQADLGLAGADVLKKLVKVLRENSFQVAVEGHTDSVPIRGRYPSNWELSGSRAGSVVRYLEANGINSDRLRAVGFADTQPLAANTTAQGRAQNRRVELKMEMPQ
ncbi:MAG TPA: OmpA family protein [Thiopseudomonas sp.]|nr:OmpA family protein [Thiopseudomonas sp.]